MKQHRKSHREEALQIWQAGVVAVRSAELIQRVIRAEEDGLVIQGHRFPWDQIGRLVVVGAGKAGAGMAAGVEAALPASFLQERVTGWVNVPADCLPAAGEQQLQKIHLHAARPANVNEPTTAGVQGTQEILRLVASLQPDDLCLVLISGGGSALLPAPMEGISLDEKLQITRDLSRAGAPIHELNLVRRSLSAVKGGGLWRACSAGTMISLIISDVIGDPLETIASGPTIPVRNNPEAALAILQKYLGERIPTSVRELLTTATASQNESESPSDIPVFNHIVGSNSVAMQAAGDYAEEQGYRVLSLGSSQTGEAQEWGAELINQALDFPLSADRQPLCILCGGETVVSMSPGITPGKGGRNQVVATAAIQRLQKLLSSQPLAVEITLLSAGTDGEDGPTDAAGGFADALAVQIMEEENLSAQEFLQRHNTYEFLQQCDALLKTGPTHTNVMDLCVVLVHPR